METSPRVSPALVAIIIALLALAVYLHFTGKGKVSAPAEVTAAVVTVRSTPLVDGAMVLPENFPTEIPVETDIIESSTTDYPDKNLKQLTVVYLSSVSVAEKQAEYIQYLNTANYEVVSGTSSEEIIAGKKEGSEIFVIVTSESNKTQVRISYLIK